MIEIGRESKLTWATNRLSEAMGGMAAILFLVWLIRGPLGIATYSVILLEAGFILIFLGQVFDTRARSGVGRAVSSFLGGLTAACIISIILVWFLGWVATLQVTGDPNSPLAFPEVIRSKVPDLVIAAVATGLGAFGARKLSPESRTMVSQPVFSVREGAATRMNLSSLSLKHDTTGVSIKRRGRSLGCVLLGDLSASFETPMGQVTATFHAPVTTMGIPFLGTLLDRKQVEKTTGKTPAQLVADIASETIINNATGRRLTDIDLPFIRIREDGPEEVVEVGPIKVREGPDGEHVKIGPFNFDSDDDSRHGWGLHRKGGKWFAKGTGDSYVGGVGNHISAKWNGSSLSLDGDSMRLSVGSDSFSYSPTEVKTSSPLHTLQVTKSKVTLDTRKFTLNVSGDSVVLRAEDKTTSTQSRALSEDLRALLTETAKKQVGDVMEGTPIDLSEMLANTEEVLARHG